MLDRVSASASSIEKRFQVRMDATQSSQPDNFSIVGEWSTVNGELYLRHYV